MPRRTVLNPSCLAPGLFDPGVVAGIHVLNPNEIKDVDGRPAPAMTARESRRQ